VRIYEESFPSGEREPVTLLLQAISAGLLDCHVVRQGSRLVALAVLLRLRGARAEFLEYLAVAPEVRGEGFGGHLLEHLIAQLGTSAHASGPLGIIFEVDPPDAAEADEQTLRLRRIEFYQRHGSSLVDCAHEYRAPNLGSAGTLPYELMWLPGPDGPALLEGPLLRDCVGALLTEGYGLAEDDDLVRTALAGLTC